MFVKFFVKPKNEIALSFHESGTIEAKKRQKEKRHKRAHKAGQTRELFVGL